jgi:aminoglycoside phosphotransferase (APT) family kinase protein
MTEPAAAGTDPSQLARLIGEMLRGRLPQGVADLVVSEPVRVFGGNARLAWACDASWRLDGARSEQSLILLVRAPGSQVQADPVREFEVLNGLAERGVRAPEVWGHDPDGKLFGSPAILLQRLPGRTDAVEYLSADIGSGRARTLDLARAAAELHAVKLPVQAVDSQVDYWRARFEQSRLEPIPVLSWVCGWLDDNAVAPSRPVLVHGDLRPGNVLFRDDHIVALLDWELAHAGDPAEDLAWAYRGIWSPERFVSLDEFVDAYEAAGGAAVTAEALRWNRVLCELKYATISLQAARSVVDGRSNNLRLVDRARTVIPAVQKCLDWVGASQRVGLPC